MTLPATAHLSSSSLSLRRDADAEGKRGVSDEAVVGALVGMFVFSLGFVSLAVQTATTVAPLVALLVGAGAGGALGVVVGALIGARRSDVPPAALGMGVPTSA